MGTPVTQQHVQQFLSFLSYSPLAVGEEGGEWRQQEMSLKREGDFSSAQLFPEAHLLLAFRVLTEGMSYGRKKETNEGELRSH